MRLLQITDAIPSSPWEMVTHATGVTKLVLVLLVVLSLVSWAIMFMKWREFRALEQTSRSFMTEFEHQSRLVEAQGLARRSPANPFTRVFERAMKFLPDSRAHVAAEAYGQPADAYGRERIAQEPVARRPMEQAMSGSRVEALRFVLDSETSHERDRLGRFIPWLATIGSVSPLIGLLGTVLGVIDAFIGIATKGSGNIAAVAPGVAEALIATAAALAVAIPAVFGYNLFANRLNRIEGELEGFGSEVIALLVNEERI
jgi:biopolymer transport protein TolQ